MLGRGRCGRWLVLGVCVMLGASVTGRPRRGGDGAARLRIKEWAHARGRSARRAKRRAACAPRRAPGRSRSLPSSRELPRRSWRTSRRTSRARWSVPVTSDRVVPDVRRGSWRATSIASRSAARQAPRQGARLHPPPASRVTRVDLGAEPDAASRDESDDAGPAPLAKGRL